MGLVKLGTIAVDGTKIKANASRHKAMSYGRMQSAEVALKAQIEALVQKAAIADEAEKNEPELDIPGEIARRQEGSSPSQRPKPAWKSASARRTASAGARPTTNAAPKTKTANPKAANPTSATLVCQRPKRRTASRILSHAS
jgi:hypothetical protein